MQSIFMSLLVTFLLGSYFVCYYLRKRRWLVMVILLFIGSLFAFGVTLIYPLRTTLLQIAVIILGGLLNMEGAFILLKYVVKKQ